MIALYEAVENWKKAKYKEDSYKKERLLAEQQIAVLNPLCKGSNIIDDIKIIVSDKKEWDVDNLPDIYITNVKKANTKVINEVMETNPIEYAKIKEHLTITPKKNAFTLIKEK